MATQLIIELPENLLHHCIALAHQASECDARAAEFGEMPAPWNISDAIRFIVDHHFHGCPCDEAEFDDADVDEGGDEAADESPLES